MSDVHAVSINNQTTSVQWAKSGGSTYDSSLDEFICASVTLKIAQSMRLQFSRNKILDIFRNIPNVLALDSAFRRGR